MNAKELFDEVTALGFKDGGEITESFIYAANRAISELTLERAAVSLSAIPLAQPVPSMLIPLIRFSAERTEEVTLEGNSVSFNASGCGTYELFFQTGERTEYTFDALQRSVKHSVKPGTRIVFRGAAPSFVSNLAVYGESFPSDDLSPVYRENTSYHLPDLIPRFLRAESPPLDTSGDPIKDASVSGSTLTVPTSFEGFVTIKHLCVPRRVTLDNLDEAIDLLPELVHLLPLLVSAYVHLDEDAELGQYYMELYKDGLSRLRRYSSAEYGDSYGDVLGWC